MGNLYRNRGASVLGLRVQGREGKGLLEVLVEEWLENLQRGDDSGKQTILYLKHLNPKVGEPLEQNVERHRGDVMVDKKKTTKKPTSKKAKATKPKEVDVFASPVTGLVYETTILLRNEPIAKDQELAKLSFHGSTGEISLYPMEPRYEARMETLIEGDMLVEGPPIVLVSKAETPFDWIKAFPKATLGPKLYASELITYYENQ